MNVIVMTPTIAAGHGLLPILMAGKDKPLTVVVSMNLFPTLLITYMDHLAKVHKMVFATLWTAPMSHIAASLMQREILVSGLATQLSADVTFGAENTSLN